MTTNLLSVIEQLVGALEEWERVDVLGREPHIHRESWKQFVQDRNTKHTAAIAAGQQALEQGDVAAYVERLERKTHDMQKRIESLDYELRLSRVSQQAHEGAFDDAVSWCESNGIPLEPEQLSNLITYITCEKALVPLKMTRAMERVTQEGEWEWADILEAAGVTEEQYETALSMDATHPQATEPAPSTDICQNCAGQGWEPSVYKGKVPCSFCHPAPSTAGEREVSLVEAFDNARKLVTPEILESFDALLQSTADHIPDAGEKGAAMPVGELTLEQITRIYDRYGGDMVNCTRAIERELAAARSQPTTEESLVVAGAQPVREPLTPDTHYQEWKHGCDSMCTNITLWIDRCPHCGKPRPVVEAAHGITKKGEQ